MKSNFLLYENRPDDFVKVNKVNSNQVKDNDTVIQVYDFLIKQKIIIQIKKY
jgi:hypothetical protein